MILDNGKVGHRNQYWYSIHTKDVKRCLTMIKDLSRQTIESPTEGSTGNSIHVNKRLIIYLDTSASNISIGADSFKRERVLCPYIYWTLAV